MTSTLEHQIRYSYYLNSIGKTSRYLKGSADYHHAQGPRPLSSAAYAPRRVNL